MEFIMHPWHLLVLALSALISHEQERVIAYLITENQVLREKLGKGRILLNDDQRRRLAVKGKVLGRKALFELATIVTRVVKIFSLTPKALLIGAFFNW